MAENSQSEDFLPKHELARIAVERARKIVKENNDMISKLKFDSNVRGSEVFEELSLDAESFSYSDSYAFDLNKIKSSNNVRDFIRDIFGVH